MKERVGSCVIFAAVMLFSGCREEIDVLPVTPGPDPSVFLLNTSFESGGEGSLTGFAATNKDLVGFIVDTPFGGGDWAVTIDAKSAPPASITGMVAAPEGENVYRLSVWGRSSGLSGEAALLVKSGNIIEIMTTIDIIDTEWSAVAFIDTLATSQGDSVGIRLSGGISQSGSASVAYDLCTLEKL